MPGGTPLKRDDAGVVQGREQHKIIAEVNHSPKAAQSVHAKEDGALAAVQSVYLDLSILAARRDSDLAGTQTLVL